MNEVYFPQTENVSLGLGSCYYINHNGKSRFHEVTISKACLRAALMLTDPKSAKKIDGLTVFFALLGCAFVKASSKHVDEN
jgi:hypothetical protein